MVDQRKREEKPEAYEATDSFELDIYEEVRLLGKW